MFYLTDVSVPFRHVRVCKGVSEEVTFHSSFLWCAEQST